MQFFHSEIYLSVTLQFIITVQKFLAHANIWHAFPDLDVFIISCSTITTTSAEAELTPRIQQRPVRQILVFVTE